MITTNKTERLYVRVDEHTKKQVEEKCASLDMSESEYLRELIAIDNGKEPIIVKRAKYQFRKELIYEINQVGKNINQIVRDYNSEFYLEYEKKKLFALMKELKEILAEKL